MNRIFFVFISATAVCVGLFTVLVLTARFVYHHPGAPEVKFVARGSQVFVDMESLKEYKEKKRKKEEADALLKTDAEPMTLEKTTPEIDLSELPQGTPQAKIEELEFDFGNMEPLSMGAHQFVIHNTGEGPLTLKQGPTTCKCTMSDVTNNLILPGQKGSVKLAWNSGKSPAFRQNATIYTNDPEQPEIHFTVSGTVSVSVGFTPAAIDFGKIDPENSSKASTIVYSQTWKDFRIVNVTSSLTDLKSKIEPLETSLIPDLHAQRAYRLVLTTPENLPLGEFRHSLRLQIDTGISQQPEAAAGPTLATDSDQTESGAEPNVAENVTADNNDSLISRELMFSGTVLGRIAIYGAMMDDSGTIDFGTLPYGQEKQATFLVRVRDQQKELRINKILTTPSSLQVKLTPYGKEKPELSHLTVTVPAGAPACSHVGSRIGEIVITTDHPRVKEIRIKVKMAIVKP